MMQREHAFPSFSVRDLESARAFYGDVLGFDVEVGPMGMTIALGSGARVFVYPKGEQHAPATFTVLNIPVDDLAAAVDEVAARGVVVERYPGFEHDERGIVRGGGHGPDMAWLTDPSGNVVALGEGLGPVA